SPDADRAYELVRCVVERQAAAKDVNAPDAITDHRIVALAEIGGRAAVRHLGVDRVAVLQSIERAAWLHGAVEIRGRERESGEAEGVGRIRLLRRDHAASRPLIAPAETGEGNGAHNA